MLRRLLPPSLALSLLHTGAIFGFFYAWMCSTLWGLDAIEPAVAIRAMVAMNESVRNAVFAPAFWGTPLVLFTTAAVAWRFHRRAAALLLGASALYVLGAMGPTFVVNVPMNQALAAQGIPHDPVAARALWAAYSGPWQVWNAVRTVVTAAVLLLTGAAGWTVALRSCCRSRSSAHR